ncbi:DUF4861 family protein [Saccharicrinis fermentans]|uniref:DUF4861 domain-containing protein n=1 Tax=Saccharicrinis fermentans DSM 9555 = JCM 21142 TaxID=869213 RepID=W7XYT7_9BACT|nr:DUF4861 family protein [Saccharicrinis fermentans]GAF03815.1 hypothetical protein JCM21142_62497 [Saccharicrinis fermentans DSM 9555 = JCM 21142]
MKTTLFFFFISLLSLALEAQNKTDASLFLRIDSLYVDKIQDASGDLYKKIGHHGPAIENEWMALRLYFNNKACAIDVYNKQQPGLELKEAKWYPSEQEQRNGYGADYYKAGSSVGLGGIRLWDGEKIIPLAPVSMRTVKVRKEKCYSQMEMLSEDIPYKGNKVDILVRVTSYTGIREMKVEAFALCNGPIQFVTGINYHKGQKIKQSDHYIISWGYHPEDVAAEKIKVGAAIHIDPSTYPEKIDDGTQFIFISKPTKYLSHWVTSTIEKDKTMGHLKAFEAM